MYVTSFSSILDLSGIEMVDVSGCKIVPYSNGGLKTGLKKPVYGPKCAVFEWSAKSCDVTI